MVGVGSMDIPYQETYLSSSAQIVYSFLIGKNDLETRNLITFQDQKEDEATGEKILNSLLQVPLRIFPKLLHHIPCREILTTGDIPQFSNMETAMYYIPKLLLETDNSYSYRELGMLIHPCKSDGAAAKYGENHAKLTMAIALASPTTKERLAAISKSFLTRHFCELSQSEKCDVLQKLCFKIPIVQEVAKYDNWRDVLDVKLSFLTDSMVKRRKHCCVDLISFALDE